MNLHPECTSAGNCQRSMDGGGECCADGCALLKEAPQDPRALVLDALEALQDAIDSGPQTVEEMLKDISLAKAHLRQALEVLE